MYSTLVALSALAAVPLVYGQGVITSAQGTSGSPASLPLQILLAENDANIINQTEIEDNVTNECGRTLLGGNIDIGANTENQLANSTVTSVTKGSTVTVLISQGTTDGAGPYTCDLDLASNADGITGQTTLTVAETDGTDGTITLAVTMPSDLACVGASTGNVCTVRCKNTAAAGPFGGCFAVQQTDITAKANTPDNIETAQTLAGIQAQVLEDQADLPTTIEAISSSGGTDAEQGVRLADLLLDIDSAAQATVAIDATATATAAAEAVSTSSTKKSSTKTKTSTKTATSSASTSTKTSSTSSTKDTGKTATSSTKDKNKDDKDDKDKRDAAAVPGRSMRWGKRWVVVPSDKGEGN